MQDKETMDEIITRHAIFQILNNDIIPCSCGAYRKILQNKGLGSLVTQCSKCNIQEPFNISDLTIIAGALLLYAIGEDGKSEFKPPKVTNEKLFKMLEDIQNHEAWVKEIESKTLRKKLQILKGGLSQ